MPLTTCPDCKSEISDQAPACPKCGSPIAGKRTEQTTGLSILIVLAGMGISVGLMVEAISGDGQLDDGPWALCHPYGSCLRCRFPPKELKS